MQKYGTISIEGTQAEVNEAIERIEKLILSSRIAKTVTIEFDWSPCKRD